MKREFQVRFCEGLEGETPSCLLGLCHEVLLKMMKSWFIDNAVQAGLSNHPALLGP